MRVEEILEIILDILGLEMETWILKEGTMFNEFLFFKIRVHNSYEIVEATDMITYDSNVLLEKIYPNRKRRLSPLGER